MRRACLVLAVMLTGSFTLPAQLPNPLNLPDPLGISKPSQSAPAPGPPSQAPNPEFSKKRYKRRHPKKLEEPRRLKRRKQGY